jgi:hypothetical protein
MLYQGGAELAFEQPAITRDMVVVIGGIIILFAGALDGVFRRLVLKLLVRPRLDRRHGDGPGRASRPRARFALRLSIPLLSRCRAGLWCGGAPGSSISGLKEKCWSPPRGWRRRTRRRGSAAVRRRGRG